MNLRPHDVPRFLMACAVAITVLHGCMLVLSGCAASPSTHDENHVAAYGVDKSLCVAEAKDYDAGEACFRKYEALWAPFWPDAAVTAPVVVDGGAK